MADLTGTPSSCCSPAAQESCCEPADKRACCHTAAAGPATSCGCAADIRVQDGVRETVRERYAAAARAAAAARSRRAGAARRSG